MAPGGERPHNPSPTSSLFDTGRRRRVRDTFLPAAIAVVGLASSIGTALAIEADNRSDRSRELVASAREARTLIERRVQRYTEVLYGMRGLGAPTLPSRVEFARFAESAEVFERLDGLRAIAFDRAVPDSDLAAFERSVRAGARDPAYRAFDAFPPVDASVHYIVDYIVPVAGNESVLGYDLASDAVRRDAVEDARDTGEVVGTAPVTPIQSTTGALSGQVLLLGAYDSPALPQTGPERRRSFLGAFAVVVELPEVLDGVLGLRPAFAVEVYDVGETLTSAPSGGGELVYDSDDVRSGLGGTVGGFGTELDLDVAGRRWRIVTTPLPGRAGSSALPVATALIGIVVTLLVSGGIYRSIAARRRRANDVLVRALEFGPDAVVVVDRDGRIVFANALVAELLGYEPHELLGAAIERLVPERSTAAHRSHREHYAEAPVARPMGALNDLWARRRDGTEVAIDVRLSPIEIDGRTVVAAAVRDVSDRRRAQAERALLASIVESTDDAIYSIRLDRVVQTWNAGAERLYGYAAEEIVGLSIDVVVPGERIAEIGEQIEAVRRGEHVIDLETQRRRKDGALIDVAITASGVVGDQGHVVAMSVVSRDITGRKATQQALESALRHERVAAEQLRATDRLKDEFLDITAHELRTPLAAILGFTDLLSDDDLALDAEDQRAALERVSSHALQMSEMIERLLDFSRLRAGRVTLIAEPLDLWAAVATAADAHETALRGVRVVNDVPQGTTVYADPSAVDHVLANLFSNAAKFSPPDRTIDVHAAGDGPMIVVRVRDHGPGVPEAEAPRLFERFYQGKVQPPGVRGTGIGLSIVQQYVRLLGGEVWIEHPTGSGACFAFSLPHAPADELGEPARGELHRFGDDERSFGSRSS